MPSIQTGEEHWHKFGNSVDPGPGGTYKIKLTIYKRCYYAESMEAVIGL